MWSAPITQRVRTCSPDRLSVSLSFPAHRARAAGSYSCRGPARRPAERPLVGPVDLLRSLRRLCCKNKADLLKSAKKNRKGPLLTEQHPFKWRHFEAEIM